MQSINIIIQKINPGVKTHQLGGHPPIVSILNTKEGINIHCLWDYMRGLEREGRGIFNSYYRGGGMTFLKTSLGSIYGSHLLWGFMGLMGLYGATKPALKGPQDSKI